MEIGSVMGVSATGASDAYQSAAKSMKNIAEGEIDVKDLENINSSAVAVKANVKMIENIEDMQDVLLSSL